MTVPEFLAAIEGKKIAKAEFKGWEKYDGDNYLIGMNPTFTLEDGTQICFHADDPYCGVETTVKPCSNPSP